MIDSKAFSDAVWAGDAAKVDEAGWINGQNIGANGGVA